MKNALACPKCQSRKIYCVTCFSIYSNDYVCAECGYTETWAHDLEYLVTKHGRDGGVKLIDTTPQQGGYR